MHIIKIISNKKSAVSVFFGLSMRKSRVLRIDKSVLKTALSLTSPISLRKIKIYGSFRRWKVGLLHYL